MKWFFILCIWMMNTESCKVIIASVVFCFACTVHIYTCENVLKNLEVSCLTVLNCFMQRVGYEIDDCCWQFVLYSVCCCWFFVVTGCVLSCEGYKPNTQKKIIPACKWKPFFNRLQKETNQAHPCSNPVNFEIQ